MGKHVRVTLLSNAPARTRPRPVPSATVVMHPLPTTPAERRAEHRALRRGLRRLLMDAYCRRSHLYVALGSYEYWGAEHVITALRIDEDGAGTPVPIGEALRLMGKNARELVLRAAETA